jgi:hypothetical protein
MFSAVNSQNSLPYIPMQVVSVTGNSKTYTGTSSTIAINITPSTAMYQIRDNNKNVLKTLKGTQSSLNVNSDLNLTLTVGSSNIEIVPSGDSNYNYYIGSIGGTITTNIAISASTITLSAATTSFVYTGLNTTLAYTINGIGMDTTPTVSNIINKNVGSYTATLSTNGSSNYILGSPSTLSWSITKAVLTVTANAISMQNGSSVPTLTYSITGFVGGVDNVLNATTGAPSLSTTVTSSSVVGTYTNAISISAGTLASSNYSFTFVSGTMTVTSAPVTQLSTKVSTSSKTVDYTGLSQTITNIITFTDPQPTYSPAATITQTNAGTYTVNVTGSGSYTGTISGTLTINKVPITITANNATITYGSSLPTFTYTPTGFKGTDTSSVISGTVTYSTTGTSSSNVGTYSIVPTVTGLSATNYTFTAANGTLTISAATISLTGTNQAFTYDGTAKSISYTISGTSITDSGYSISSTSATNAGSYTARLTSSSSNYAVSAVNNSLNWTINAATLTATTTSARLTYNGSSQSATVISGINGTYAFNTGSTSLIVSGTNVGSYTTTINGTGNYTGSVTGTLTISAAAASSSPASGTTVYTVYDGTAKSATVISGLAGLSYSGSAVASGVNAGTYSTTVTLGGNYSGNLTGYLVISQATGFVSLYTPTPIPAGDTNTKLFSDYFQSASSTITWSYESPTGPGAGDAYVQPGYGVQSLSFATAGFSIRITATISDPNYTPGSDTKTIVFSAYVPSSGGGGTTTYY